MPLGAIRCHRSATLRPIASCEAGNRSTSASVFFGTERPRCRSRTKRSPNGILKSGRVPRGNGAFHDDSIVSAHGQLRYFCD